jgi:hypothetical protein
VIRILKLNLNKHNKEGLLISFDGIDGIDANSMCKLIISDVSQIEIS